MIKLVEDPVLVEALACAARGWPVFPCRPSRKEPAIRGGFKAASTDVAAIRRMWQGRKGSNLGVATGAVSGLVVLDIDVRHGGDESLEALEHRHGALPETVESLTGGGGRHLLFKHPSGRVRCSAGLLGPGLDVRGDGGYIIAPPSVHPSGRTYEWELSSHPESVSIADLPAWLLRLLNGGNTDTEDTEGAEDTEATEAPRHSRDTCNSPRGQIKITSIEQAIEITMPKVPGERNRAIFEFARALKALPSLSNAEPAFLRPYVEKWHLSSVSATSGEHDFADTWADFLNGWKHVKYPLGTDPIGPITQAAEAAPMPADAPEYTSEPARLLVRLCRELQRTSDKPHFYLTYRAAAKAIGVDKDRAGKYLHMLHVDGVIELVHRGHSGRSSEYRYLLHH